MLNAGPLNVKEPTACGALRSERVSSTIMANPGPRTQPYADSSFGNLPAACNVWRCGDADSTSARTINDSAPDAGCTTAGALLTGPQSVSPLPLRGAI